MLCGDYDGPGTRFHIVPVLALVCGSMKVDLFFILRFVLISWYECFSVVASFRWEVLAG